MNLITLSFEVTRENQAGLIKTVGELKGYLENKGFFVSLFIDMNEKHRFLQTFLTEQTLDKLTDLIQSDRNVKALFSQFKDSGSRVVVSYLEQIV